MRGIDTPLFLCLLQYSHIKYGYAIVFSIGADSNIVKAIKMKRKNDIILAVVQMALTLIFSIYHIIGLIASSTTL